MTGIRLAEVGDLARIATTATRAFAEDPLLRWFFPHADAYAAAAPAAFGQIAHESVTVGCTYVTADAVAVGIYFPPGHEHGHGAADESGSADGPSDGDATGSAGDAAGSAGGTDAESAEPSGASDVPPELAARFEAFGRAKAEHTPPEPHWYLNVLATHPDWQRQGLGRAIVAPIAERARAEGVPLFLETQTAANVAYYRHLGFTVRSEWDLPPDGPHMWGMILTP